MRDTVEIVGINIDKVTFEEAEDRLLDFLRQDETKMIFTPNSEFLVDAVKDRDFSEILNDGDLVIPDGIGLVIASKFYGMPLKEKVAGCELMTKLIEIAYSEKKSIYFLGGKEGVAEEASQRLNDKYPGIKIAGFHNGYFDEEEEKNIIDDIIQKRPDIIFVALGAPKQEKWIYNNRHRLGAKIAMGVGGSLDILAGRSKRAPEFYQKTGLEWLYRLLKEPKRFFRMLKLPKFIALAFYDAKTR
ncbi:WecB/TagA/CpsF family glycosyltransferase [Lutispora saccharofermentans]|uniref:N-acetylglucosaminyldiphosphoundecaprenol N-acetyl-beta-D-mannosaminyltransferase n=1 Tax=Lutispora saccharofermentans TaxID=3024236 RepID=A0ABT1NJK6_9FIRM|nr:WecB/TagA/CpsF family glycosyltransferase [Lutispora saccharofermentans]MCQ1531460.1 WecB/TagA/CpsF family glycosyltransferase [Lutispora saccharofermentans]